ALGVGRVRGSGVEQGRDRGGGAGGGQLGGGGVAGWASLLPLGELRGRAGVPRAAVGQVGRLGQRALGGRARGTRPAGRRRGGAGVGGRGRQHLRRPCAQRGQIVLPRVVRLGARRLREPRDDVADVVQRGLQLAPRGEPPVRQPLLHVGE